MIPKDIQNLLYTDTRYNEKFVLWRFHRYETFSQEVTLNQKLCKNIVLILQETCFGYLLESPHWCDSNKYLKHIFYAEKRINQASFTNHSDAFKDSLQRQIHFNGSILGTNDIVINEGPLC